MNTLKQYRSHKPTGVHQVHESAKRRWVHGGKDGVKYRPQNLTHLSDDLDALSYEAPLEIKKVRGFSMNQLDGGGLIYHTIVKGDTLGKIAKIYLGHSNKWKDVYNLNRGIISDPDKIYVGQVIRVPNLEA